MTVTEQPSTQTIVRVVIYIRVSTEEQAHHGYSIAGQKTELVKFCDANGYTITDFYIEEGLSGKNTKRPKLQQLLSDSKKGLFDAVLVYKLDRFSRSVKDLYELIDVLNAVGVGFISKQEKFDTSTAIGRLFFGFLAILAQFERELTAERVKLAREQQVREGKRPGGKYPFGYDKEGNQIPDEVEQLRRVKDLYMNDGLSYQGVAEKMIGTLRRGYEWTAGNVALTLENPFYAGIIRTGGKLPNGKYPQRMRELKVKVTESVGDHEPVWSIEEFQSIINRMRSRSSGGYSHEHDYAFNGMLRCGRCGASMYGRMTTKRSLKNGNKIRTPYYWCSRRKGNKSCDQPMFREAHVEHLLKKYIERIRLDQNKIQEINSTQTSSSVKELQKLKKQLDKIKARIKKWQYAFVEELISAEDLRDRMAEEAATELAITKKIESLNNLNDGPNVYELKRLDELWDKLSNNEKNEMARTIFSRLTLITDVVNPKGVKNSFFPSKLEVEYR